MNTTKTHLSIKLNSPCTVLHGVGARNFALLQKLGITTIQDLLFHLPFRYQDRTRITPLSNLRANDYVAIEGTIVQAEIKEKKYSKSFQIYVQDSTGRIVLRFFHVHPIQFQQLSQCGKRIRCFGEVRWRLSGFEMIHPEFRLLNNQAFPVPVEEHLTPIYPTTEGLHQILLRKLTDQVLKLLNHGELEDLLPKNITQQFGFMHLSEALHYVHRPPSDACCELLEAGQHPAQQRLAFEELLAHQLSLLQLRKKVQQCFAPIFKVHNKLLPQFLQQLPFQLTTAQKRVVQEITDDLACAQPMLRLVQGDVGSGKTVVAALAALMALENKFQVAIMGPTEILTEQHFLNFQRWFQPLNINVAWLTGKLSAKAHEKILAEVAEGKIQVIIGTHALFQEDVQFFNLGLIIVDEQHRFGVHQRLALREKGIKAGQYPHQLIMTATPIPRTLAMTAYADLDCSIIDELPPGRNPVTTIALSQQRRMEVIQRVRENCLSGKQGYWVCTLIEESEVLQCQAAEATTLLLKQALPELQIGLIHGRLKGHEKEKIMTAFKNKEIHLLVATTVIEVGVDVPNASLMIIENPERLGLAQLHQLRGRIGRGSVQSHCVLLYQSPLSLLAKQRLDLMRNCHNGFEIAQKDLELRGAGEMLGTKQTGLVRLKVANLIRDKNLLLEVQKAAQYVMQQNSQNVENIIHRWMGNSERYGNV